VDLLQAIVYGIVQGATEYLPVSSTAHLTLVPPITGWPPPSPAFDILVQLGTLGAVCVYLRKDLAQIFSSVFRGLFAGKPLLDEHARRGWMIVVATLPAVVFGLLFKKRIEAQLGDVDAILWQLLVNGMMLIAAESLASRIKEPRPLTWLAAIVIGFGQAVAILPSISRSGATIAAAMLMGVRREEAGRFSFLMSIPVMLGAGVLGAKDLMEQPDVLAREGTGLAISFSVAAIVGFAVIAWFLTFVRNHKLYGFGVYCIAVAAAGLVWLHTR
jgi:undecaprenyl-diphosphatase